MMTTDQYLIAKLAEVMADYVEDINLRIAIGCVVRNRAKSLQSWAEALKPRCQHAFMFHDPNDPAFRRLLWAAEAIYYNQQPDITHGAEDYGDCSKPEATKIGNLYFYKSPSKFETIVVSG